MTKKNPGKNDTDLNNDEKLVDENGSEELEDLKLEVESFLVELDSDEKTTDYYLYRKQSSLSEDPPGRIFQWSDIVPSWNDFGLYFGPGKYKIYAKLPLREGQLLQDREVKTRTFTIPKEYAEFSKRAKAAGKIPEFVTFGKAPEGPSTSPVIPAVIASVGNTNDPVRLIEAMARLMKPQFDPSQMGAMIVSSYTAMQAILTKSLDEQIKSNQKLMRELTSDEPDQKDPEQSGAIAGQDIGTVIQAAIANGMKTPIWEKIVSFGLPIVQKFIEDGKGIPKVMEILKAVVPNFNNMLADRKKIVQVIAVARQMGPEAGQALLKSCNIDEKEYLGNG
jgi:hypothetical protein